MFKRKIKLNYTAIIIFLVIISAIVFNILPQRNINAAKPPRINGNISYTIDEEFSFYENYISGYKKNYILKAIGGYCNIWVEYNLHWNLFRDSEEDYILIANKIDGIYKRMTDNIFSHAGSFGDIDNDGKINILLSDLSKNLTSGYYSMVDIRETSETNNLDILYIDISKDYGYKNFKENNGMSFWFVIAHEFQHMLNDLACNVITTKVDKNALWLNESLSSLAAYLYSLDTGTNIENSLLEYFLADYGTDNGFLYDEVENTAQKEYLSGMLFGLYLNKQLHEINVIKKIYEQYSAGVYGVDAVENAVKGKFSSFEDLFDKFTIATYFDGILSSSVYKILDTPIIYNSVEYDSLFKLRLKNDKLFSELNRNNVQLKSGFFNWSDKLMVYDKQVLENKQKFSMVGYDVIYYIETNVSLENLNTNQSLKVYNAGEAESRFNSDSENILLLIITKDNKIDTEIIFSAVFPTEIVLAIVISVVLAAGLVATLIIYKKKRGQKMFKN